MLSIQSLVEIAAPRDTLMSAAMIRACMRRHARTGEPCVVPPRARRRAARGERPAPEGPGRDGWRRMVEGNRDTRATHC